MAVTNIRIEFNRAMVEAWWKLETLVYRVFGTIVLFAVIIAISQVRVISPKPIRTQGRTAQTLGIPVNANPELDPAARRIWLDGYMDARREHLRKMGMLRSDHGDGTAEIIEDID